MTPYPKGHPDSEVIEQYSLGHLSETEFERFEEHLLVCERCQDELSRVETFIRDMKYACAEMQRRSEPEAVGFFGWRWLAAFQRPALAGAFAVIALMLMMPMVARYSSPAGAPVPVDLAMMRGAEGNPAALATAGRPVELRADLSQLPSSPSYRFDLVNSTGSRVRTLTPAAQGQRLVGVIHKPLAPGSYWVRLFGSGPDPIREYALEVR